MKVLLKMIKTNFKIWLLLTVKGTKIKLNKVIILFKKYQNLQKIVMQKKKVRKQ